MVDWCCVVRQFISFIGTSDDTMTTRRMIGMKSIGSSTQPATMNMKFFLFFSWFVNDIPSLSHCHSLCQHRFHLIRINLCTNKVPHSHMHASLIISPSASRPQPTNQQTKWIKTKTKNQIYSEFLFCFFFSVSSFRISGTSTRTHYTTISIFTVLRILTIAFASSLHFFFSFNFCVFFSSFSFYFFFFFVHFYFVSFLSFHFVHGRE